MSPEWWDGKWWEESFSAVKSHFSTRHLDVPCDALCLTPQCWSDPPQHLREITEVWRDESSSRVTAAVSVCSYLFEILVIPLRKENTLHRYRNKVKQCSQISAGCSSRCADSRSCLWFVLHLHSPDPGGPLCRPSAALSPSSTWCGGWQKVLWLDTDTKHSDKLYCRRNLCSLLK